MSSTAERLSKQGSFCLGGAESNTFGRWNGCFFGFEQPQLMRGERIADAKICETRSSSVLMQMHTLNGSRFLQDNEGSWHRSMKLLYQGSSLPVIDQLFLSRDKDRQTACQQRKRGLGWTDDAQGLDRKRRAIEGLEGQKKGPLVSSLPKIVASDLLRMSSMVRFP